MQYPIQVPDPCHEAWSEMTPNGNGRHCDKCAKTVVDFTSWEVDAIQEYLLAQGKNRTCGRFRTEQLTPVVDKDAFVQSVAKAHMPVYKKIAAILLLAFGLIQMSCNTDEPQPTNTRRQLTGVTMLDVHPIQLADPSQVKPPEPHTIGFMPPLIVQEDTTHLQTKADSITPLIDESIVGIIKGDVEVGMPDAVDTLQSVQDTTKK